MATWVHGECTENWESRTFQRLYIFSRWGGGLSSYLSLGSTAKCYKSQRIKFLFHLLFCYLIKCTRYTTYTSILHIKEVFNCLAIFFSNTFINILITSFLGPCLFILTFCFMDTCITSHVTNTRFIIVQIKSSMSFNNFFGNFNHL